MAVNDELVSADCILLNRWLVYAADYRESCSRWQKLLELKMCVATWKEQQSLHRHPLVAGPVKQMSCLNARQELLQKALL
jgi:hypothetical protein